MILGSFQTTQFSNQSAILFLNRNHLHNVSEINLFVRRTALKTVCHDKKNLKLKMKINTYELQKT